jgi:ABC-type lipoprotein release transport system permease subunit
MSPLRLIFRSLVYHGRTNLAVALGAAAATAVLTGALLVGDSMQGSLRNLTLQRLGRVDQALVADRFFRTALADQLAADPGLQRRQVDAVPAILLSASLETAGEGDASNQRRRAGGVQLLACDERFWKLGHGAPQRRPGPREIVLNRSVAERLGAGPGSSLIVYLPRLGAIPADSPLGRKQETVQGQRVTVCDVISDDGLGRFALSASQQSPRNAFVALDWLQQRLEQPGHANLILVAGPAVREPLPPVVEMLAGPWRPALADYGIHAVRTPSGYLDVTSERMLLEPAAEEAICRAVEGHPCQPVLTYLANTIACRDRKTPYSTITAIDFVDRTPLGPMISTEGKPIGPLGEGQIVLNQWTADDLQARPGDRVRVSYFDPESSHGETRELTAEFTLLAVARLEGPAADQRLTPEVRGVTDQRSMADWDAPFPFDARRIRAKDDKYWNKYRATPKAFVSLAAGRRLWGSRFGRTTSIRVGSPAMTPAALEAKVALDPQAMGMSFRPLKAQGLAASAGTTPFSLLFLGFSMFTIAAAVMLVALLFRLGTDARASQVGLLLALGLTPRRVARLLAAEGLVVVTLGGLLGVGLGVGYAALMLAGLRTWWLEAVAAPFLQLNIEPASLVIGFACGLLVALTTIGLSLRRIGRTPARRLLDGQIDADLPVTHVGRRAAILDFALLALVAAIPVALLVIPTSEAGRAVAFFVGAMGVLAAILTLLVRRLRAGRTGPAVSVGRGNLLRLALRGAARNPARSGLSIGLVAAATFLIVALSAFRLDPRRDEPRADSGNGGFALIAHSDQPFYENLNLPAVRSRLGLAEPAERALSAARIYALRVRAGDDASCRNLYRPQQPRILGVPADFVARGGFAWAQTAARTPAEQHNPWLLLDTERRGPQGQARVPVVIDKNTAAYSLHLDGVGAVYRIADGQGGQIEFEVVGLLDNSLLQGDLIVSERALVRCFPRITGYQAFLVECPPQESQEIGQSLELALGDYGLVVQTTGQRLAELLAVQNTYLSAFQSLGGLGLLLGTLGLAAVQLRGVLQRRRELALLRAAGFSRGLTARLILFEAGTVLVGGLGTGVAAALVAVLPQLIYGGAGIPWWSLAGTLATVLLVGLSVSGVAVRLALAGPLVPALRSQ